jgi:hypothetical protein
MVSKRVLSKPVIATSEFSGGGSVTGNSIVYGRVVVNEGCTVSSSTIGSRGGDRADYTVIEDGARIRSSHLENTSVSAATIVQSQLSGCVVTNSRVSNSWLRLSEASVESRTSHSTLVRTTVKAYAQVKYSILADCVVEQGARIQQVQLSGVTVPAGARIRNPSDYWTAGPARSSHRQLFACRTDKGLVVTTGCFTGTPQEFVDAVQREHVGHNACYYYACASAIAHKFGLALSLPVDLYAEYKRARHQLVGARGEGRTQTAQEALAVNVALDMIWHHLALLEHAVQTPVVHVRKTRLGPKQLVELEPLEVGTKLFRLPQYPVGPIH